MAVSAVTGLVLTIALYPMPALLWMWKRVVIRCGYSLPITRWADRSTSGALATAVLRATGIRCMCLNAPGLSPFSWFLPDPMVRMDSTRRKLGYLIILLPILR